ncbi:LysM peptidoglycan-binding domain-containing protein [Fodinicola feengrottensis]|uniref:LysM peptidoglycan-binding domain-containing protein n=1 Tax=Fodinicola feengrottensis TaxID=435914 RepID=UPI0013D74ADF|nr:LysM peptidoglycan-binding domain-containing protein [Fodinicola feengrottensis]
MTQRQWEPTFLTGLGRVVRAILAAAVLITLVIAPPWLLLTLTSVPLPDHAIGWDDIVAWNSYLSVSTLVLRAATCIGWVSWAALASYIIATSIRDGADQLRAIRTHDHSPRGNTGGPLRAAISGLVGLIIAGLMTRAALASDPSATVELLRDRPAVTAPPAPTNTGRGPVNAAAATAAPQDQADSTNGGWYEVHKGDNLSKIAKKRYGKPRLWTKIWQANRGHRQPEGNVFLNPNHIEPHWRLWIPGRTAKAATSGQPGVAALPALPPTTDHSPATKPSASTSLRGAASPHAPPASAPQESTGSHDSPPHPATPAANRPADTGMVDLPGGGWLTLAAAGALSAALALAYRRRRRSVHYRNVDTTTGEATTPLVRALHQTQRGRCAGPRPHHPHTNPNPRQRLNPLFRSRSARAASSSVSSTPLYYSFAVQVLGPPRERSLPSPPRPVTPMTPPAARTSH